MMSHGSTWPQVVSQRVGVSGFVFLGLSLKWKESSKFKLEAVFEVPMDIRALLLMF